MLLSQPLSVFQPPPPARSPHARTPNACTAPCMQTLKCVHSPPMHENLLPCVQIPCTQCHALPPNVCTPPYPYTPHSPSRRESHMGCPTAMQGRATSSQDTDPIALTALWVQWGWWQPPRVWQSPGGATLGVGCSPRPCCVPALCPVPAGRCAQRLSPRLPAVLHLSLCGCERGAEQHQG